jgi:hypothetical protein
MDSDLQTLSPDELIFEINKLRAAIRKHRDASGHDLCWYHPELWSLLPEQNLKEVTVPEWPQFMRGCVKYRQSLDEQIAAAQRIEDEFKTGNTGQSPMALT